MDDAENIRFRFELLAPLLDERARRLLLGAEAACIGYGGVSLVSRVTGVSREAISEGTKDVKDPQTLPKSGIRRKGGGRKRIVDKDPTLKTDLERLIDPATRGDPMSPLRWTCKSLRKLAAELNNKGHKTSHQTVAELLHEMNYSLQGNRKTKEGASHPDRNAQFEYINEAVRKQIGNEQPAISVDTKKKELVGAFKNPGQEYHPKGQAEEVLVYDFPSLGEGKVNPYGVYDLTHNAGWVSVGTDRDTAAFAVETIRRWWYSMGRETYPGAKRLLITADSGGSNGARVRLWKKELQDLANEAGMEISVCHFPPGTSKWNKIEHRMFSFITQNWRGKPLVSHEVIVNLIGSTTTKSGLEIRCELDTNVYPRGIKVTDQEFRRLRIIRHSFHGEWNYTIRPRSP